MPASRDKRKIETVRRYLEQLADSAGNSQNGRKSIDHIAEEYDTDAQALRDFRDGHSEAISRDLVNSFAKALGKPTASMIGLDLDDGLAYSDTGIGGMYGALMAEEQQRSARLRHFHLFDQTRPEVHSAHDAWADLAVTGNIGDVARYNGGYEAVVFGGTQVAAKLIKETSDNINANIIPDDVKWLIARGMAKYGDQYGENQFGQKAGRNVIEDLLPRHPRTMFVHRDYETGAYDYRKAYKQVLPGRDFMSPDNAFFPEWKIIHFKNATGWGDLYGEAILNPCLRSAIQVEAMETAMIIRRLERASQRYKHFVDVGLIDGGEDAVRKELMDYRRKLTKIKTVDGNRNMRMQKITLPPGEDVYIPKRDKESPADIMPLEGDQSIGEITDFLHFFNKFLAGLGPPKAHLGYEADTMRSVITDLHIVFARKVRRLQVKFIAGLNKLYWIQLILAGIDPRSVRFQIFPPALGTRDELVRAQVQLAYATTCRYLSQAFSVTGKQPSVGWMLQTIMGLDEEAISEMKYDDILQVAPNNFKNDPPTSSPSENKQLAAFAQTSPEIMEQRGHLQWLMQERALGNKKESGLVATDDDGNPMPAMTQSPPFGKNFDDVVRGMGIKELRRVA